MTGQDGPVFELTLEAGPESAGELDSWLQGHVDDLLGLPGFRHAQTWRHDEQDGRIRRIVHFSLEDEEQLQRFLDNEADAMRADIAARFGDRCVAVYRTLRPAHTADQPPAEFSRCLNCDAVLTGQYCGQCGQRARSRLISIRELARDAFGDLFELDSRLWQTILPLTFRPGRLTLDYLQGRRVRYMPPFRMYLVLSLAFFLFAFFDPYDELGILFEVAEPAAAPVASVPEGDAAGGDDGAAMEDPANEASPAIRVSIDGEAQGLDNCSIEDYDPNELPPWLARRFTKERIQAACENIFSEKGEGWTGVADRLVDNIPVGLFILLPLMALVLTMLHPLSRRYYVEHLLFVVHYHSFVFLALSAEVLFTRLVGVSPLPNIFGEIAGIATGIYIPVYLYKAMRRVYRQGHPATFFKFSLLVVAYLVGLGLIVTVAGVLAAFSA